MKRLVLFLCLGLAGPAFAKGGHVGKMPPILHTPPGHVHHFQPWHGSSYHGQPHPGVPQHQLWQLYHFIKTHQGTRVYHRR